MARETKVGLLAGLAFIVCFAVILANRGQPQGSGSFQSLFVGDEATPEVPVGVQPGASDRGLPVRNQRTASPASFTQRQTLPADGPYPHRDAHGGHGSAGAVTNQQVSAPGASGAELPWSAEPTPTVRPTDSMLSAFSRDPNAATQNLELYLNSQDSRPALPHSAQPSNPQTQASAPNTSDAASARRSAAHAQRHTGASYTVVSGDTLTSIVQRHYGSRSKQNIDAVLDANRSVLADPDVLKVDMVLLLPDVTTDRTEARPSMPRGAAPANRPVSDQATDAPGRFRYYQVRANDRYVTIAREQLGDASRWHELHELNKDKFPNPDRIREGVRIKLPVDEGTGNGRRR